MSIVQILPQDEVCVGFAQQTDTDKALDQTFLAYMATHRLSQSCH